MTDPERQDQDLRSNTTDESDTAATPTDDEAREHQLARQDGVDDLVLRLPGGGELDLRSLSKERRQELVVRYGEKVIDELIRQGRADHDKAKLDQSLGATGTHTRELARDGVPIQVEGEHTDEYGSVTWKMGTQHAPGSERFTKIAWIIAAVIAFIALMVAVVHVARR